MTTINQKKITDNKHVLQWVEEMAVLCQPSQVVWCDGSEDEKKRFTAEAVAAGDLEAAQRDFQEVATLVRDAGAKAEAHANLR